MSRSRCSSATATTGARHPRTVTGPTRPRPRDPADPRGPRAPNRTVTPASPRAVRTPLNHHARTSRTNPQPPTPNPPAVRARGSALVPVEPPRQRAAATHRAKPALHLGRVRRVVITSNSSSARSTVRSSGTNACLSRTTMVIAAGCGRRSSNRATPRIRDRAETRTCTRSASRTSSGADSSVQVPGRIGVDQPEPAGEYRQGRPLYQGEHHDQHEHHVEQPVAARYPADQRKRRQHDRHRPAQPRPGHERLVPPRDAERHQRSQHRQRPRHEAAVPRRRPARAAARCASWLGMTSSPSMTNRPICASQPTPSANERTAAGAAGPRCRARSRPGRRRGSRWRRRHPAAANATNADGRARRAGTDRDAGSDSRAQHERAHRPIASPTAAPTSSWNSRSNAPCGRTSRRSIVPVNVTTRITVGASLNPDSASSSPATRRGSGSDRSTEKTAAASVDATTAPSSNDELPGRTEQQVRAAGRDPHADQHTHASRAPPRGRATARIWRHSVASPPSMRITASAAYPGSARAGRRRTAGRARTPRRACRPRGTPAAPAARRG